MSLAEFHFIRPYWLLAFIPAFVIVTLIVKNKLSRSNWSAVCDTALLPYLLQEKAVNSSRWPIITATTAALLTITALAGPTWERLPTPVFRNDSALVIALDLSRSMDAEDIKPSRLIRARYKIADILRQRKEGQTALLVYAGDAFTVTPLTTDTETIASQLSALTTDIMPSAGSNPAVALEKAVELFKQAGLQKGQIILITDGVDADSLKAAHKVLSAASGNYQLSILGIGTAEGAPIPAPRGGFLKDQRGTIIIATLNGADLAELARAGKGIYQTATSNDTDVQALLATLDKPTQQQGVEENKLLLDQWDDKGPWLLLLVLPLAALTFRKGLLCFALLLLLPFPKNSYAFEWQDLWQSKDQQAQQAYNNNQFDRAAKLFENSDWKAAAHYKAGEYDKTLENLKNSETALSAYNQGNALAKSGKLEEAIKAYEKALAINPHDADAQYNKDLVEKELKKQKQEQDQKKQDQKKEQQSKEDAEKDKDKKGDKSEEPEDRKKSENEAEQPGDEKKSEQKQPSENQEQQNKAQQKKDDAEKSENAQQAEQEKSESAKEQPAQQAPARLSDEEQQANEQWLKRIPDDPAGLLKRKFKYQYGQRDHPSNNAEAW